VGTPLVEAHQHGFIRIQNPTKILMSRRVSGRPRSDSYHLKLRRNVTNADDRPYAFHRTSDVT